MRYIPKSRVLWISILTIAALVTVGGLIFADRPGSSQSASEQQGGEQPRALPADELNGSAGSIQNPMIAEVVPARTDATATRVQIPSIGVDSTLEQLPLDPSTNELTPPVEWMSPGWYRDGIVPGDVGPAVIAGHVDSVTAPAVFARLGELAPGDDILVTLSNGTETVFVVDSSTSAPKNAFPASLVYGPTPTAQLRLITCDGAFDGATGHYVDNLIVFASVKA